MKNKQLKIFDEEPKNFKAIIIGQAPPKIKDNIPFQKTRLYKWFEQVNISKQDVNNYILFDALIGFYPGPAKKGDNKPQEEDILKHLPSIKEKIISHDIEVIIPVGSMAIEYILGDDYKGMKLNKVIGKSYKIPLSFMENDKEYLILPLPHPSGLSTWQYQEDNKKLLDTTLNRIKQEIDD